MHYEINVAKDGQHLVATHERSLNSQSQVREVLEKMQQIFPEEKGYRISISKIETVWVELDPATLAPIVKDQAN